MTEYAVRLNQSSCENIYDIIEWCHQALPKEHKSSPWKHPRLNHGLDLLESEGALDCYMSAYGDMHTSKCRAAMMNFPFENLKGSIEIVDWGCGQGLASGCVLDILKQRGLLQWVKKVTLIEPSQHALLRAVSNIKKITRCGVQVDSIEKFLPAAGSSSEDSLTSVGYRYENVIHLFSNILDVKTIDLASVARFVACSHGKHFVLCVGPKNGAAYRLEQFCAAFGRQEYFSKIDSVRYGRTSRTGHPYTCMTRCFVYDGSPLDISRMSQYKDSGQKVLDEYDMELQFQNHVMSVQKARVAYRLQNILSADDIMYIDPIVNEVKVDFIIVRPNKGLLLINVFEHDLEGCEYINDKKEISLCEREQVLHSPIEEVNLCQASIKDGIEELLMTTIENSSNFRLIKKAVIFTENSMDKVKDFLGIKDNTRSYTHLFGKEFIQDKSISLSLYNSIGFIHNSGFDDAIVRRLSSIISPSWHSYQEGRAGVEPKGAQKRLVVSHSTMQKISGVAGSGKTYVLAARAINAMKRTGGDVLILTYNITLANYLKVRLSELREDFSWDKIDIYNYHQFFRIRATECRLHVDFSSYDDISFFKNAENYKRYAAIFVDEVQDYTTEWLRIVSQNFLEENGEFVVFGDPKQNIYHRPLDSNNDIRLGVIGGVWNKELNTGRRFVNPTLASLATSFQSNFFPQLPSDTIITEEPAENALNFQVVSYLDMRKNYSLDNLISELMRIINSDNNDEKDFVILGASTRLLRMIDYQYRSASGKRTEVTFVSTESYERLKQVHRVTEENITSWKFKRDFEALERTRKQLFTTDKRCLKISTIQSFKGWESPSVIVILEADNHTGTSSFCPMAPETVYTAITRARENLYIVNIGNEKYADFFKKQSL